MWQLELTSTSLDEFLSDKNNEMSKLTLINILELALNKVNHDSFKINNILIFNILFSCFSLKHLILFKKYIYNNK